MVIFYNHTFSELETWPAMWNILRRKDYQTLEPRTLAEDTFQKLLWLESKRSRRSQRRFALMLLEPESQDTSNENVMNKLLCVLPASTRKQTSSVGIETDQ